MTEFEMMSWDKIPVHVRLYSDGEFWFYNVYTQNGEFLGSPPWGFSSESKAMVAAMKFGKPVEIVSWHDATEDALKWLSI